MKILVLCQSYPSEGNFYAMMYVHQRNLEYLKHDWQVDVLNFSTDTNYQYQGINVLSEGSAQDLSSYEIIISHAPNIKNHYRFIKKHSENIKSIFFTFHGHEILTVKNYYPEPYAFNRPTLPSFAQSLYDWVKLRLWRSFFNKEHSFKTHLNFVSNYLKNEFLKNTGITPDKIHKRSSVIQNIISERFIHQHYDPSEEKAADVICIRPFDEPKYGIDLATSFARANPQYSFHFFGKGRYFEYNQAPENVCIKNEFIANEDLPTLFNQYRFGLLPTKWDSQGVIMCEMATYGIPLITSDLPICKEMVGDFPNTFFIDNNEFEKCSLESIADQVDLNNKNSCEKFALSNTIEREIMEIKKAAHC